MGAKLGCMGKNTLPPDLESKRKRPQGVQRTLASTQDGDQVVVKSPLTGTIDDGEDNLILRQITQNFDFSSLTNSNDPKIRELGSRIEKAFKDPILEIRKEFGLEDDAFFKKEEEVIVAGPFSDVKLMVTDKSRQKWVDTLIHGQTSLVLLKNVGAPITMLRVMQETEFGHVGGILFEYEVPINFTLEKIQDKFTAISFNKSGEFFGFYFSKSVADCTSFNQCLTELHQTLRVDQLKYKAILEVSLNRAKQIEINSHKLANTIDTNLLLCGTGSNDHQRELMKVLALAGVNSVDLQNKDTMEMIQEVLTDFIADGDINKDDVEFAARGLAFRATDGFKSSPYGSKPQNGRNMKVAQPMKKPPPQSLQKKVTWGTAKDRKEETKQSNPNRLGITSNLDATDSLDDTMNVVGDETEELQPKNSLFDKDNIFTRFGAVSEVKSIRDAQKSKLLRKSEIVRDAKRQLRRQTRENDRIKKELDSRAEALNNQRINHGSEHFIQKLTQLTQESNSAAKSQKLTDFQKELFDMQTQFADEKRLLQDRVEFAEKERDQLREQLLLIQQEKARLEKKVNNDTVNATRNMLNFSSKIKGEMASFEPQSPLAVKVPPPPAPIGARGPPSAPIGLRGPPSAPRAPLGARGPVSAPPPQKPQPATTSMTLAEQLAKQSQNLKKPNINPNRNQSGSALPQPLSLADQLQEQLKKMKAKTEANEAKKSLGALMTEPAVTVENEPENTKAWCLTKQLKSRMDALHKGKNNKSVANKRKKNYKHKQGLSDGDTTPSDFDPDDSQNDSEDESD